MHKALRELENVKLGIKVENKKKGNEVNVPKSKEVRRERPISCYLKSCHVGDT